MVINTLKFVDLYICEGFADIKGLDGSPHRVPAPPALAGDIAFLLGECQKHYEKVQEEEFSLNIEGAVYRVTVMTDVLDKDIFILRRSVATIRPLNSLGYGVPIQQALMAEGLRGLVLVAGEMAAGKTSTISSVFVERLKRHGGVGMALEDPPETALNGEHGRGRCIQIAVSRRRGGYKEPMTRAVRSGADIILIGEIRDEETAVEALRASINGHLILSSIHAGSLTQAIERLQTFSLQKASNTNSILADGLSMVVWQRIDKGEFVVGGQDDGESRAVSRLRSEFLMVRNENTVKTRIRDGKLDGLIHDVKEQQAKMAWDTASKVA